MDYPQTITPPWNHQQELWKISQDKPNFYIAHDMGCGKTKSAIDYATSQGVKSILIISPKLVRQGWQKQFGIHSPQHYNILVPDKGTARKKTEDIDRHIKKCTNFGNPHITILNYEIMIRPPLGPSYDKKTNRMISRGFLLEQSWDLLIVDEAHRIKSPGGKASWNIARISKHVELQRYLSGTPMPHSPLDIYAQYRSLDNSIFGTRYDYFRHRYAIMGGYENRQVVEFKNLDELNKKFFSIAHYVSSDDALDLPEESNHILKCELSSKAAKIYAELKKEFIAWVGQSEISADNALVKLLRLAQITGGYLKLDNGSEQIIDENKIDTVIDFLMDLPPKEEVVIFCRFQNEIKRLKEKIEKKFAERSVGTICGFLNPPSDFYDSIWHATDTNTLIVQVDAGGEGIDLTATRYCVFMSMGFSLGQYRQCRKRVHRPGQTRKTFYYHIIARGTVDQKIMTAIEKKKAIVDYILEELNPHRLKN
jgi:SNF2 family DNA or RNA helicase